jgi:hypothetical protein
MRIFKMATHGLTQYADIPCCPELDTEPVCDVVDFRRRLIFPTLVRTETGLPINVEVTLHTRFVRCAGPLKLGDLAYSTTLLPNEKVRLATTDRRSRFSFDSESKLSYRSEQISEEQYRLSALRAFMADENSTDRGSDRSTDRGSWDFHGDASGSIGFLSASADANARGSHNAASTRDYLREHRAHAESSDHMSVEATRKAHALSVGEVSTRSHQAGESEDHFEASSREFSNPNQCHAITFLFYRLNKTETVKFSLESIERRVIDPIAPSPSRSNPLRLAGQIATIPQSLPATNKLRLEAEARGLQSEIQYLNLSVRSNPNSGGVRLADAGATTVAANQALMANTLREAALAEVDQQLAAQGLLDAATGAVSPTAQAEIGYERKTSLPTPGVIVKSCLDDCNVCEEKLGRKIDLELDRLQLQNELLKKQIELLDKSQEYRCCPAETTNTMP